MRFAAVELRRVQIPLRRAFKHALHERQHTDAIFVTAITDEGLRGWGEILPRPYVTGESIESVLHQHAPEVARDLLAGTFSGMDDIAAWIDAMVARQGQALATACGFDLAVLDAAGRAFGVPVARLLGGVKRDELPAGVIIGFEIATPKLARYCATLRLSGRKHVKVKVGLPDDLERLAIIGKVFRDMPLRIDANAAWGVEEAVDTLERMKSVVPIASVEQPIDAAALDGLRAIRECTGVKIMADESVCSLADAERLVTAGAADIFNVRLGKNGGLLAGRALVDLARAHGVEVHLGTMVGESGVLSRASEIFGRCIEGFECLDGKGQNAFLLEVDILDDSSDHPQEPTVAPGLGLQVSDARLQDHQVGETLRFSLTKETA